MMATVKIDETLKREADKEKALPFDVVSKISTEERERRNNALREANAIIDLEGLPASPEFDAIALRHVNGEISQEEFSAQIDRIAEELARRV
jgi:hypothetical protein